MDILIGVAVGLCILIPGIAILVSWENDIDHRASETEAEAEADRSDLSEIPRGQSDHRG